MPTGPGQSKLDPYLIKTGALDSVIKQTIYEANLFNTANAELTNIYEQHLQRIADIERERKENNDPGLDEEEEHYIITQREAEDTKLPKLKHLQELNKPNADRVLTDIQNGMMTRIKGEEIQQKKAVRNELKDITMNMH